MKIAATRLPDEVSVLLLIDWNSSDLSFDVIELDYRNRIRSFSAWDLRLDPMKKGQNQLTLNTVDSPPPARYRL